MNRMSCSWMGERVARVSRQLEPTSNCVTDPLDVSLESFSAPSQPLL